MYLTFPFSPRTVWYYNWV